MIRLSELKLPLSALPVETLRAAHTGAETDADRAPPPHPVAALRRLAAQALGLADDRTIADLHVFKRSFDARKANLQAVYIADVALAEPAQEADLLAQHAGHPHIQPTPDMAWHPPHEASADVPVRPVVVGFGPCGIFAALALAQMGFRPVVLERGKAVRERTKDTWELWRKRVLHAESNVQFGEGGAGTFSDGKLYSQIKDPRHLGRKVMREFVQAGAPEEILYAAHPHIGTFKLVKVVENLRARIVALGGEVRFSQRVTDVHIEEDAHGRRVRGLRVQDLATGETTELRTDQVVMALGHSARDTFGMLYRRGVWMEAKPFSIGFRIEHPQSVIDRARWGRHAGHPLLGAADYKLVHHAQNGRAVYSFCMCPGGTVVAATSEPGRVVTNGMSQYSRNERNANAGIVVGIDPSDYPSDSAAFAAALGEDFADTAPPAGRSFHPLAGIVLQRQLESGAYVLGGSNYEAPGQLVGDFLAGRASTAFASVEPSYRPGVRPTDLRGALPHYATTAMQEALPHFGRKIRGFDMPDAVLTGVETRTSAPLQITRGADGQSLNTAGLYPAGEGAGYAGGILSAGVDGIKMAEALARQMLLATAASRETVPAVPESTRHSG
ncbi:NAD(P)/FAD-dependent oxidoreductase [Acidovorax sp. SRB_24]|uniref:NAD(P)/FAD-dependent oxidoreductase n=1 Tax=Acidovorax sp. SRB_24 TaxID=1962700 RepID=UPI00145F082F|nr:FAD-dependent oxidoreductase [Acidovorax sp. SRB_24]NMM75905.1 FAD-dependent oxidoreductase [Acidovorax sp. SRB_24]